MALDVQELMDVMTTALLRELGDEVDLIFRYGSFISGNTHTYSDLDISYVPVHEATGYHITVTVGDMLCDLYPIRWPQLESMARWENVSSTVLLNYQIVYQRSVAAGERMGELADQLQTTLQPAARPMMVRKAQEYLQRAGYPYYLLRQQAAAGHSLACIQQAQSIVAIVTHALALVNQQLVDTRKLAQILTLPQLPTNFAASVAQITTATAPNELLAGCDALLDATHALLVAAQRQSPDPNLTYATVFGAGYPELKGDLQHLLLACERRDAFSLKRVLVSLYQEVASAMTRAETGVDYGTFHSLADYEQDLGALGFPALLPAVAAGNWDELHCQCLAFDRHLRQFLTDRGVNLYDFATVDDLRQHLALPRKA